MELCNGAARRRESSGRRRATKININSTALCLALSQSNTDDAFVVNRGYVTRPAPKRGTRRHRGSGERYPRTFSTLLGVKGARGVTWTKNRAFQEILGIPGVINFLLGTLPDSSPKWGQIF